MPAPSVISRTHVDLLEGWQLTTVTALQSDLQVERQEGLTIELKGRTVGFERAMYAVTPNGLEWRRTVRTIDGKESPGSRPVPPLFEPAPDKRLVRVLFLTRASEQDHNSAILTAASATEMEALTAAVRARPQEGCVASGQTNCVFVPNGVVARAERPDGRGGFIPVL